MNAQVYQGDCLETLRNFDDKYVDLIYLDPPFFTQKTHKLRTRDGKREFSFEDSWASHSEYAKFIFHRLKEMWRVLSPTGSLFFHCDRNASHIIRLLLDDVFKPEMFRSEIIWYYRRWSNAKQGLLPAHQNIYFYTKSDNFTFNLIYQDYSLSTNIDQILQKRERDESNKTVYARDAKGKVIPNGEKKGVPLRDVWDIPYLNPKAKERTGYPTQKPLLLLERIIKIASNPGDVVLDPFCGSGTTLVAARLLNRKAIGIDVSEDAIEITRKRLKNPIRTSSRLLEKGRDSYKNSNEEALALLQGLEYVPVQRNKGIDAILKQSIDNQPILVRVQRSDETILEAAIHIHKAAQSKNAAALVVVAIQRGGYFAFDEQFPSGVMVVESPALSVDDIVEQLSESHDRRRGKLADDVVNQRQRLNGSVAPGVGVQQAGTGGL